MAKVTVDGEELEVADGITVMQACEEAGKEIPRFCYHDKLAIAGNCRMCLVEVEKTPKLQASCAFPVMDGMIIHTNTPKVKKAREGVMEFLLINHPLDCPICDQAGECDLQDQAYHYGLGKNRFVENKRSVEEKEFGPLIKSHMTRCIHCTRCIRFSEQIAGVEELGATGRGEDMEVGTYIKKALSNELSGNMIDLCPVGALTSRPYAFKARSWELKKTETIDILDAVGSNIRVDARGSEVMRILPRLNESINEDWISDKTRFAYDGLKMQRLDKPMIKKAGRFKACTWDEAYNVILNKFKKVKSEEISAIAGDLADVESMFALKELIIKIDSQNIDCRTHGEKIDATNRSSYMFNTTIEGIEESDFCLIIGANPRHDAPLINARLRKRSIQGGFYAAVIGETPELNFKVENLGNDIATLEQIISGEHEVVKKLENASKPMIILGVDAISRKDGAAIIVKAQELAKKYNIVSKGWNGFNVLHKAAGRVGGLDIGFVPSKSGKNVEQILESASNGDMKLVFLLGGDEVDCTKLSKSFVVYIGHHGDNGATHADVILPAAAYTEKNATYVNTEGRPQRTRRAVFAPGEAKEDWLIITELAVKLGHALGYDTLTNLREKLIQNYPHLGEIGNIALNKWNINKTKTKLSKEKVTLNPYNFYMTDVISRASVTMANCSKEYVENNKSKMVI